MYGDFYIGGRQFASLSDLIGYYTQYSDLLKRERLEHPVPPPEPVTDRRKAVAVLPYTKMPDTEELRWAEGCRRWGGGGLMWRVSGSPEQLRVTFARGMTCLDTSL